MSTGLWKTWTGKVKNRLEKEFHFQDCIVLNLANVGHCPWLANLNLLTIQWVHCCCHTYADDKLRLRKQPTCSGSQLESIRKTDFLTTEPLLVFTSDHSDLRANKGGKFRRRQITQLKCFSMYCSSPV